MIPRRRLHTTQIAIRSPRKTCYTSSIRDS